MDLYKQNLEFLKNNLKSVYETLLNDKPRFKSIVSVVDSSNIKVGNDKKLCLIHSIYNIERETVEMFSAVEEDVENLVVFGMGMWHCRNYILSHFKNLNHLIIVEPDMSIFNEALHRINIAQLIKSHVNTTLIVNRSEDEATSIISGIMQMSITSKMDFAYSLSYRSLFSDYYDTIHQGITTRIRCLTIKYATEDYTLYKWAENTIRNYKQSAIPLTKFINIFEGIPIIIVSAGPSLNYSMQYLNKVKNNAVILAVGSAIKILDSNGIVPHFRLAIDPNESEISVFDKIDTGNSTLIFADSLCQGILEKYKGNKVRMTLDTDYISQYIFKSIYEEIFLVSSGFSVANVALDLAIKLGFQKIIFIGQDLCYTGGELYAKGSWYQEESRIDFESEGYIKSTNILEETVYTDRSFLGMRDLFENIIRLNPGISYINATERGLNINGAVNKPFDSVMKEDLAENRNANEKITQFILQSQADIINWDQRLDKLDLNGIILELININEHRIKKLIKLRKQFERGIEISKLKRDMNEIEAYVAKQLENIEFYQVSIKPSMNAKYYAIQLRFKNKGTDEKELFENSLKATLGKATEMKVYLDFLLEKMSE